MCICFSKISTWFAYLHLYDINVCMTQQVL